MSERELRDLLAWRAGVAVRRGRDCASEATLSAYAGGNLDTRRRSAIEEHLADCDHCLAQVGFLARTEDLKVSGAVPRRLLERVRSPRAGAATADPPWRWQWAAAAAAIAVIAGALWLAVPSSRDAPEPTVRGEPRLFELPELLSPREGDTVTASGASFRWQPVSGALYYRLRLVTASGDLVWEEQLQETTASLPADVRLQAGDRYFVWVRAYTEEGRALRSPAVGFTAARAP